MKSYHAGAVPFCDRGWRSRSDGNPRGSPTIGMVCGLSFSDPQTDAVITQRVCSRVVSFRLKDNVVLQKKLNWRMLFTVYAFISVHFVGLSEHYYEVSILFIRIPMRQ